MSASRAWAQAMSAPDGGQRHAGLGDPAVRAEAHRRPGRGHRPVADAPVDLLIGATGAGLERHPDLQEHLVILDGRLVGAAVKVVDVEHPVTVEAADDGLGADRRAHRPEVLGRVGLAQRAADRPAVADDGVSDDVLGVGEDRGPLGQQGRFEQFAVAGHGADADLACGPGGRGDHPDVAELAGQSVDVDQVPRGRQPQLHHRQQRVAAGQDPGLGPELAQQLQRVLDAGCALVFKRCRDLHLVLSPAVLAACTAGGCGTKPSSP